MPWGVSVGTGSCGAYYIKRGEITIAVLDGESSELDEANAAFIVTACNEYASLKASAEKLELERERGALREALEPFVNGSMDVSETAVIIGYEKTETALKKARAVYNATQP